MYELTLGPTGAWVSNQVTLSAGGGGIAIGERLLARFGLPRGWSARSASATNVRPITARRCR
jgi:hypothetical protein